MSTEVTETGAGLSPRHEEFAIQVAAGNSFTAAYAVAYGFEPNAQGVRASASRLAKHPAVVARVKELRTAAAEQGQISVRERMAWLQSIVAAEPVANIVACGCRHCWGEGNRYQWRDEAELAAAVTKAAKASQPMPDCLGGFGYRPDAPANEACPHCAGQRTRIELVPYSEMTAGQRALYRGVECNPDGSIKKVLIHDQLAAADQLNRLQGAYLDRSMSISATVRADAADLSSPEALLAAFNAMGGQ
jgi:hypothetical protein